MEAVYVPCAPDMESLVVDAGFAIVSQASDGQFAIAPYESHMVDNIGVWSQFGINTALVDKQQAVAVYQAAGVPVIPTIAIVDRQSIEDAPFEAMISKPSIGSGKYSPSPFDYKTYQTKAEALAAFDADQTMTVQSRKPILQRSFASLGGETSLLICGGAVNGRGQIHFEPVIQATHREDYGPVYRTIRGAIEDSANAQYVRDATTAIIGAANARNTVFSLQYIVDADNNIYPMDFQYRLDYFNRYAFSIIDRQHTVNIIKFAYDRIDSVDTVVAGKYVMRAIDIAAGNDAAFVRQKMDLHQMILVNQPGGRPRVRIFIGGGQTFEQAISNMDQFEEVIS